MIIELRTGGKRFKGWENVTITKSMQAIADTFTMDIFDKDNVINIGDDDKIEIFVDNELFLTGYVDDEDISISDTKRPLKISGRSNAGDLIDCNILENKQYTGLNIQQIVGYLIEVFNLGVSTIIDLKPLDKFDTKVGETYFNAIDRLCKQNNVLPISDVNGYLLLVKNEDNKTNIVLKDGDFKSLNYPKKRNNRFSSYTYKKEAMVVDVTDATIKDETVGRFRPFVGINTEDKSNEDIAKWKKNNNDAASIQLKGVVYGWDLRINTIVKIETEIVNQSFLIKDITYSKGDAGTTSSVTFVSKDLYNV